LKETKKKEEPAIKTRPAGKLPPGSAFQRVGRQPDGSQMAEILGLSHTPSRDSTPSTDSTPSRNSKGPIAPARDFARVANSIVREAVPWGVFGGKSKQLYDFLYSQTRGAIVPKMSVIISKLKLMAGADIGSEVTLKKNLDRLKACGLVSERVIAGVHGGNEFTIFLPEEITPSRGSTPSTPSTLSTDSSSLYKREPLEAVETSPSSVSLMVNGQRISEDSKTSFKTNTGSDDDEAFARLVSRLRLAVKEITGREAAAAEATRWDELAELLVAELKIAAGRTTVSSVPAFLTEHLRRRLWKKEKRQIEAEITGESSGPTQAVDASQCPDCFGTGMWYPQGYEKGVARCTHDKLQAPEPTTGE
jgi:hypothetical protein